MANSLAHKAFHIEEWRQRVALQQRRACARGTLGDRAALLALEFPVHVRLELFSP
jgi:hypothetical protein